MSIKALPAVGLHGYYYTGEYWLKISVDANGKVQITSTDLTTILSRIGANTDVADMADSLFAGQEAIFENIHEHVGIIVGDKSSPPTEVSTVKTALEKKYKVDLIDDDDVDSGNCDLDIYDVIFVAADVTSMTKINELTTLGVPIFTGNAEVALTILRMGDDSGGSGTGWGSAATETQVNIVDNTHQITLTKSTGNNVVYSSAGAIVWIRASDVVAGCVELAEISGDNTKSTILVLPYDVADEDGTVAPMPRVFWGMLDPAKWNTATETMFYNMVDWAMHQGRREVQVQGLGKINQINQKLGTELSNADNLYDYIVTGANEAGAHAVITANKVGSVLERLEALMQKDTSPAFDSDDDSLEAISEAVATILEDTAAIQPKIPRIVCKMDFKSLPLQVTLTSTAGDRGLVDIEVSGLPSGVTIVAVEGIVYCDSVENTHDGVNYLESTKVQVKEKTTGTDRDAITLEANKIFRFTAQMVRGGTVLTPDWATATAEGIIAEVDDNGTYQMWFDVGETVQDNIVLDGAVFMLRIWYLV